MLLDVALKLVTDAAAVRMAREKVRLDIALGRVLPESVSNPIDQPPFDKSAMDGFAYASASGKPAPVGTSLRIVGTAAAGVPLALPVGAGECVRIMTGASLPSGADFVQRVEFVREDSGRVVFTESEPGSNVVLRAAHLRAGENLMGPRILTSGDIGVLAAGGIAEVEVSRRPRTAVLSTGSELLEPGSALSPGRIYDSNRYQLLSHARSFGCDCIDLGLVSDDPSAIAAALERGFSEADFLLVSGGVSMGDFDYLPRVCASIGVEPVFHKVAIKPGKPVFFGLRKGKAVFALPGNPLAAFICFELLVVPFIRRLSGLAPEIPMESCRLGGDILGTAPTREEYVPVRISGGECTPIPFVGSSMATVLALADGFARLPIGISRAEKGSMIDVRRTR